MKEYINSSTIFHSIAQRVIFCYFAGGNFVIERISPGSCGGNKHLRFFKRKLVSVKWDRVLLTLAQYSSIPQFLLIKLSLTRYRSVAKQARSVVFAIASLL